MKASTEINYKSQVRPSWLIISDLYSCFYVKSTFIHCSSMTEWSINHLFLSFLSPLFSPINAHCSHLTLTWALTKETHLSIRQQVIFIICTETRQNMLNYWLYKKLSLLAGQCASVSSKNVLHTRKVYCSKLQQTKSVRFTSCILSVLKRW